MANSHFVLALVLKAVAMVISTETTSQCHDADGTIYLQTQHSQKMGDAMGAAIANGVNYTQVPGFPECEEEGACCFGEEEGIGLEVTMVPRVDNGCGDLCCSGTFACANGLTATARSIRCDGSACERSELRFTEHLECDGDFACLDANIVFAGTRGCLDCDGFEACYGQTVEVQAGTCLQITCSGTNACEGLTVVGTGSCFYTTDGASAPEGNGNCEPGEGCQGSCPKKACCTNAAAVNQCADECRAFNSCDAGGSVVGDPHITTIDGKHFTELSEGTYLLWSFDGFNTQVPSAKMPPLVKKMPVDFKIYSHYAGQMAFAKAVLVVEKTATGHQALEMTSHDCVWRRGGTTWHPAKDEELLKVADADGDTITAMKVSKGPKAGQEKLLLFMNTETGLQKIAQLWVRCHPRKHLDAKIKMASAADTTFVKGELGPGRQLTGLRSDPKHGLNLVVTGREFAEVRQWTDLGGSDEAAAYLKEIDSQRGASNFLSLSCTSEEGRSGRSLQETFG